MPMENVAKKTAGKKIINAWAMYDWAIHRIRLYHLCNFPDLFSQNSYGRWFGDGSVPWYDV
jgi:hypothetical protein